tara:strand:+ start:245 stop:538 length:294 start_codon:yes stop_codon:yes gene_type:complete
VEQVKKNGFSAMGETARRARLRIDVLKEYFKRIESGEPATQEELAKACEVSVHAVGRVLRWAASRGLPVSTDYRVEPPISDPTLLAETLEDLRRRMG